MMGMIMISFYMDLANCSDDCGDPPPIPVSLSELKQAQAMMNSLQ